MYIKDGLGSVQAITNEAGQLVQRYIYSSFGKILKTVDALGLESSNIKTGFSYTNREFDEETGLYYYRARYYDAYSGRFLQEDPHPGVMGSPSTFNSSYIYSLNNPSNRIDPNGKFSLKSFLKDFTIVVGASLAGVYAGGLVGASIGGPLGFIAGVVVGAIAGAVTAIAINGVWNTMEGKRFFADWQKAAVMGAIAGAIAGGTEAFKFSGGVEQISNKLAISIQEVCAGLVAVGLGYAAWKLFIQPSIEKGYENKEKTVL